MCVIFEVFLPSPLLVPPPQGVTVQSELIVLNSIVLPHKELGASFKNQIIL